MKTVKQRTKKRGVRQNGYKQDGETPSMDMCPSCISFGCDPAAMSDAFNHKVRERMRQKCCPACGEPKEFCRCRSTLTGKAAMRSRNNKKLRTARQLVKEKEAAYRYWQKHEAAISQIMGEDAYSDICYRLYHHDIPETPFSQIETVLQQCCLDTTAVEAGWR